MAACPGPRLAVALMLLALSSQALASFEVELGGLKVLHPGNGRGRMNVALANFGEPKYGATLIGEIVYPNPSSQYSSHAYQCKPAACNYGCSFFNESSPTFKIEREPGKHYVMLLDRGPRDHTGLSRPCYFLDKAFHAQMAGADALLVVNDGPGDLSTAVAPKDEVSGRELQAMSISAGLISQGDGEAIKAMLTKGPVSVALNWTDLLPKASKVEWEFWTNSNDECGAVCDKQRQFVKDFKPIAKQLESAGLVTYQPHYLIWVCQYGPEADECKTQCIRNGAYCCPDPDDNIHEGYSGADVLLMNVRSLCLARVARDAGEPWLWWEYVDRMGAACRMGEKKFNAECSETVFGEVTKGTKLEGDAGHKAWHDCLDFGPTTGTDPIKLLDEELAAQTGQDQESTIAILPTVRVNKRQYRGILTAPSVLRALCSGFPSGAEPPVCNEEWVSDNECAPGHEGWRSCNSYLNTTAGRTKCVNTFNGYACECGEGFMKVVDKETGEHACSEVNECLVSAVPFTNERCKCERCACLNTVGSYNCTGPLPDMCTKEHNWGGCWRNTVRGSFYHACRDNIKTFKWAAQFGISSNDTKVFECVCPPCFKEAPGGGCEPACDLGRCNPSVGCPGDTYSGGGAAPPVGGRASGGVSAGGVFFMLLASMALTAGGMYAAYTVYLKQRMQADMRNILEEYVPLASSPSDAFTTSTTPRSSDGLATPRVCEAAQAPSRLSQASGAALV